MVAIESPPPAARGPRFAGIDALRGVAILAMIVYHLSWDLSAHGLIEADVVEMLGWRLFARSIASTFLFLVGVNLVLAARGGFRPRPFLRRLAILVVAAGLVSLGTYWLLPDAFVFFGILHCIAAASVLALPFLGAPIWLTAIAAVFCLAAPYFLTSPFFDAPGWLWLGLSPDPPPTVDYVPILPWFGAVLFGVAGGRLLVSHGERLAAWHARRPLGRFLVFTGRWSLAIYLIHQPILLGILFVVAPFLGPSSETLARRYEGQCSVSCAAVGYDKPTCQEYCTCIMTQLEATPDLLTDAASNNLTPADRERWEGYVEACRVQILPAPALNGQT